jgi:hypothetical protein
MLRSKTLTGITVIVAVVLPVAALAHAGAPSHTPALLPKPHISVSRALVLGQQDVRLHGPLAAQGGYISGVDYGRLQKLSSGARIKGIGPKALVWGITYTDPTTRTKSRQIIDASTGKVLTRVYYAPGLP